MFAVMEMDPKDMEDEWSATASPIEVLQQLSQEAVRLAGEAWQSAYPGGPLVNPSTLEQPRHRRAHSEVVVSSYRRSISSSNFHKWKSQMQKALHWGGRSLRVDSQYSSFNPEVLANQKRQWYQLNSKTMDPDKYKEPSSLFEHFFVVGIHPDAKLEAVEDAFIRKKKWEQEMERTETVDFDMRKRRRPSFPTLDPQVKLKLATAEEAVSLSLWSTATICRVLSLESILSLVTGVLLEKQVVVLCPNLGVLSAVVLSLIPIIRPFEWQSLFLPILPGKMVDFLDAPVPFIVGIQHKLPDLKMRTSNLVRVNIPKTKVKTCILPLLPKRKELISELRPIHSILSREASVAQRHPVYKCNEVQADAAAQFLSVMNRYLESLCADLRLHTITSVQSNNDKVSILLRDSFIDSFPAKDQPFIKDYKDLI
ncbi:DENN domain-containing protein 5B [Sesamum angolense]|uniref:DENN domain-containing protein 5B n=1 Tax=Sesamum angolense TaxID=2727404 RepID=A0AAE1XAU2_9LAMI|nr:DENN domain-containing protein 5B [Sesamum angolense]